VSSLGIRANGTRALSQWMNLFEITNRAELAVEYRLLEIRGLHEGDHYNKQLNLLTTAVAREIRQPVALVRRGETHSLAIPSNAALPRLEQKLTPHVATLVPDDASRLLEFAALTEETSRIAISFLQFALRTPLWRDQSLWASGRASYSKRPLSDGGRLGEIDLYPGFVWNIVTTDDGRVFVALDTVVRYVDRTWLPERLNGSDPKTCLRRHCVYHYGHQWFPIQIWGFTGLSIDEQRFLPPGSDSPVDVFTYTRERWQANPPPWVRDLDPRTPALVYRYPGKREERYGALGLCKLTYTTADAEAAGLHHASAPEPARRFQAIVDTVSRHFGHGELGGRPIHISASPLEAERRVFPVPAQRFGHGRVLRVGPRPAEQGTDVVDLAGLGQRRLSLLLDPRAGPLDTSPFDTQYLLWPQSSPRALNEDFENRFAQAMRQVSGQPGYSLQRILYDDRSARTLYQKVQAIKSAISGSGIGRGYVLLVLPERADRDLHNYIKRELWPDLQLQCAMARKIRGFYEPTSDGAGFRPRPDRASRLNSYVRNCAFGMMVVNRKWSWALAQPLHYDVYVGIDVLNGMAGFTFVYQDAEKIFFHDYPCKLKERLSAKQIHEVVVKHLREDLANLGLRPRTIVIHRDGRTFSSELDGLRAAVRDLIREGRLPTDAVPGVVDIRKSTADHLRLVEGESLAAAGNPTIGSSWVLGPREGIVSTTGVPFRFPGTAKPLAAVIVEGPLDIERVLEDIFALSQPCFTSPDKCTRLPLTIKLADDFLEPIASDEDEDEARYGSDDPEALELVDDLEASDGRLQLVSAPQSG